MAGKLVRDKVPEIILQSGRVPNVRILDPGDYRRALCEKLLEEVDELALAASAVEVIEEAADVLEVLTALAGSHNITLDRVVSAAQSKREERGGFDMRLWLETVEPESS